MIDMEIDKKSLGALQEAILDSARKHFSDSNIRAVHIKPTTGYDGDPLLTIYILTDSRLGGDSMVDFTSVLHDLINQHDVELLPITEFIGEEDYQSLINEAA